MRSQAVALTNTGRPRGAKWDKKRKEWFTTAPRGDYTDASIARLERVFHFPSFADALAFTNRVGALAEEEGHHPALLTEWGRVTVTWWTHKIRGLHRNDFIMAAKTDALAADSGDVTRD